MKVPKSHPRYLSLKTRDKIVEGVKKGVTSIHGLLAHGRGEAFDYMIGEKTTSLARKQIKKAAKLLLKAKNPVISVNGNVAALCAKDIVKLSKVIPAKLEVNIFHSSKKRERAIINYLKKNGAKEVLLPGKGIVKYIEHNRKFCNPEGISKADVVFVPLEDGDRCMALRKMGKKVITIDLNAKSRTAQSASVNIVDNIIRTLPLLIKEIMSLKKLH
jgi:4-phosphopantoate---beta-alanine ligase